MKSRLLALQTTFEKYSAIATIISIIVSGFCSAVWYASKLDSSVGAFNQALLDEHSNMRAYVDSHLETTNVRIDDLASNLEKTNTQVLLISERVDNSMGRIEEMNKATSDRLDKIWITIDQRSHK